MEYVALIGFFAVIVALFVGGWSSVHSSRHRRRGSVPSVAERAAADAGRTIGSPTAGQHDLNGAVTPAHLHEVEHGHVRDVASPPPSR